MSAQLRTATRILLLVGALTLGACDRTSAGAQAYEEGRHSAAFTALTDAVESAGGGASCELQYDLALAALAVGESDVARTAIDAARVLAEGDEHLAPLVDFLAGNVAYALCDMRAKEAASPEAEPFAYDTAIARAEEARDLWAAAAMARDLKQREDWPQARRNIERALRRIEELVALKAAAEEAKKKSAPGGPPRIRPRPAPTPKIEPRVEPTAGTDPSAPPPPPKPTGEGDEEPAPDLAAQLTELDPAAVSRLLETLAAKERERRAAREERQRRERVPGSRDW